MKDLTIAVEENVKLNVRTTGVFTNNGKVLVHKCEENGHAALPGGRVKAIEDSITALKREVDEELGLKLENLSCAGVVENFFSINKCDYHEYMWLIKGDFVDKSVYEQEKIYGEEDGKELIFEWVEIDKLKELDFKPVDVIPYLENIDGGVKHIITKRDLK